MKRVITIAGALLIAAVSVFSFVRPSSASAASAPMYNPNNPYVFIDNLGNMHRLDYLDSERYDYYDKDTNRLHDSYNTVVYSGRDIEAWTFYNSVSLYKSTFRCFIPGAMIGFKTSVSSHFDNVSDLAFTYDYTGVGTYSDHVSTSFKYFCWTLEEKTLAEWLDYISENPITITYTLAEPQVIEGRAQNAYITYEEYLAERITQASGFAYSLGSYDLKYIQTPYPYLPFFYNALYEKVAKVPGTEYYFDEPVIIKGVFEYSGFPSGKTSFAFGQVFYGPETNSDFDVLTITDSFVSGDEFVYESRLDGNIYNFVLYSGYENYSYFFKNIIVQSKSLDSDDPIYNQGYDTGYDVGYNNGESVGYNRGNQDGYNSGYPAGLTDGQATGYSNGYTVGYGNGMDVGSTSNITTSWFTNIIRQSFYVLGLELFPGFYLGYVVGVAILLPTAMFIIRLIKR